MHILITCHTNEYNVFFQDDVLWHNTFGELLKQLVKPRNRWWRVLLCAIGKQKKLTNLIETTFWRKDGDVTIISSTCSSTHFSPLMVPSGATCLHSCLEFSYLTTHHIHTKTHMVVCPKQKQHIPKNTSPPWVSNTWQSLRCLEHTKATFSKS